MSELRGLRNEEFEEVSRQAPALEGRADGVVTVGVTMTNDPARREMGGIRSI